MVNYTCAERSHGKLWWKFEAILTCKSIVKYECRGERLIEPSVAGSIRNAPQRS